MNYEMSEDVLRVFRGFVPDDRCSDNLKVKVELVDHYGVVFYRERVSPIRVNNLLQYTIFRVSHATRMSNGVYRLLVTVADKYKRTIDARGSISYVVIAGDNDEGEQENRCEL